MRQQSFFAIVLSLSFLGCAAAQTPTQPNAKPDYSPMQGWQPATLPKGILPCTNLSPSGYPAHECFVAIKRDISVSPPTLIMPGKTKVYIQILDAHPDESIAFNATTVRTAPADLAADALKSFVSPLSAIVFDTSFMGFTAEMLTTGPAQPPPTDSIEVDQVAVQNQLVTLVSQVQDATTELTCLETYKPFNDATDPDSCVQTALLNRTTFKAALDLVSTDVLAAGNITLPVAQLKILDDQLKARIDSCSKLEATDAKRSRCIAQADKLASTEARLNTMVTQLQTAASTLLQSLQVLLAWPTTDETIVFALRQPQRTNSVITITGTEVVTKTATTIASVTVNWQAYPFVLSTGVMFSGLQYRTYAASPLISGGVIQTDPVSGKNLSIITETKTTPSIDFPLVLGSYALPFLSRAKWENSCPNHCAFLISGGVGLDLTSKTADLMVGPTFQIGGFLITPGAVFGRQAVLDQNLTVG
jgi:hypothetical protein